MPMLSDRRRGRVLVISLVALAGAVLLAVLLTAWTSTDDESSAAQTVRRVGLMHVGIDHIPPALEPLKARLAELGWTEGKNIELIFRNLEPEQAEEQARQFVRARVDAIVAFEDQSIDAAEAVTARARGVASRSSSFIPTIRCGTNWSRACRVQAET